MSLQTKVAGLLLAIFVLYLGLEYVIQQFVILPGFARLEQEEALKDMERAVQTIEREIGHLSISATDWATWDDTYQFVQDRNADYREKNLNLEAMQSVKVNLMFIVDTSGAAVWKGIYDLESEEPLSIAEFTEDRLPPAHPLLALSEIGAEVKGLLLSERDPMLLASKPILISAREGPIRGAMVLGRSLDPAAVEAISEQARVALTVMPAGAPDLSPEEAVLLARLEPRTVPHIVETERLLQIYSVLPDLYGTPAVLLRVDVPRTILAQGRHTFAHAILSTLMVGLGVLLLLTAVLRRSVLKPLRRITEHAVVIGQRDDLRSRLTLDRKDELGVLAGELDRMVERLAEARRRLIDQSYHAGIAEMASGVLHNIGNAITPLCERVSTLDEALRAAPTAEMEMAVTELGDATTPPERRTDLARFVELAGCDLAALATRTREEMAAIAHQVTHIQQILTDQERYSRAARVLEPVDVE